MTEPIHDPSDDDIARWHRTMGPLLFNRAWQLLDKADRTSEDEDELLSATFGQRYHWYKVGSELNMAIADWQVSRVAAILGDAELADRFARHSLLLCETHDLPAFYKGYAHEAIARAADVMDDLQTRDQHVLAARELLTFIEDETARAMLDADVQMIC
jgi:hypothetical protein